MMSKPTEEDFAYCRECLQKVKVPYPVIAYYEGMYYRIEKEGGPVTKRPDYLDPAWVGIVEEVLEKNKEALAILATK